MTERWLGKTIQQFKAAYDGEISLSVGDIVVVEQTVDKFWLYGRCGNQWGNFPSNIVSRVIDVPIVYPGERLFVALSDFASGVSGDLVFRFGEFVVGEKYVDEHWWSGRSGFNQGIFPVTHVWEVDSSLGSKPTESYNKTHKKATVLMKLTAQLPEELSLDLGDEVIITEVIDKDWYRGECNGRNGIFPAAFVKVVESVDQNPDLRRLSNQQSKQTIPSSGSSKLDNREKYSQSGCSQISLDSNQNYMNVGGCYPEGRGQSYYDGKSAIFQKSTYDKSSLSSIDFMSLFHGQESTENSPYDPQKYIDSFLGIQSPSSPKDNDIYSVLPYGRALYTFQACYPNELSFQEGEIIYLRKHIDSEWMEGSVSDREGIFPKSFIEIIVDVDDASDVVSEGEMTSEGVPFPEETYAYVLYNFQALFEGDLNLTEGEVVRLVWKVNDDWYRAQKNDTSIGVCPSNYLRVLEEKGITPDGGSTLYPMPEDSGSDVSSQGSAASSHFSDYYTNTTCSSEESYNRQQFLSHMVSVDSSDIVENSLQKNLTNFSSMSQQRGLQKPPIPKRRDEGHRTLQSSSPARASSAAGGNLVIEEAASLKGLPQKTIPSRPAPPLPARSEPPHSIIEEKSDTRVLPETSPSFRSYISEQSLEDDLPHQGQQQTEVPVPNSNGSTNWKEKMTHILDELVGTEEEYLRDLKLTCKAFKLNDPSHLEKFGVDIGKLFGNIDEVIDTSEILLTQLKSIRNSEAPHVGAYFMEMAPELSRVYSMYCINHDNVTELLRKYRDQPAITEEFQRVVQSLRVQMACFDMRSILIKPVQRILRYPLLLDEMSKVLPNDHPDKQQLLHCVQTMTDVATGINENKRKIDLVNKYKEEEDKSLTGRFARITMHSVAKKSSRLGARVAHTLGIASLAQDPVFESEEQKLLSLERFMSTFKRDVQAIYSHIHELFSTQLTISEKMAGFYVDNLAMEADRYRMCMHVSMNQHWGEFEREVNTKVLEALAQLLQLFNGPLRLVQKRHDKLLDYGSTSGRAEKNKDPTRTNQLEDEKRDAERNYLALNNQLKEELPVFREKMSKAMTLCVSSFLRARRLLAGRAFKGLLELKDLPLYSSQHNDAYQNFLLKYNLICSQLGRLSFVPPAFIPEEVREKVIKTKRNSVLQPPKVKQVNSHRSALTKSYPPDLLYKVVEDYQSQEEMELNIHKGYMVAVIKTNDPMGNQGRWFVDSGVGKGLVPKRILKKVPNERLSQLRRTETLHPRVAPPAPPPLTSPGSRRPPLPRPRSISLDESQRRSTNSMPALEQPRRRRDTAGPIHRPISVSAPIHRPLPEIPRSNANLIPKESPRYEELPPEYHEVVYNDIEEKPPDYNEAIKKMPAPPPPPTPTPPPLPPQRSKMCRAGYAFAGTGENELPMKVGEVFEVMKTTDEDGNPEWWLVKNGVGDSGYVPANHVKPYTLSKS